MPRHRSLLCLDHGRLALALCGLLSIPPLAGCSEDDPTGTPATTAAVAGRVTGDGGFSKVSTPGAAIEGATVTMARIRADGSLETVSSGSVQTNAAGEYTVEADIDNETHLVVRAQKESSVWMSVVSDRARRGEVVVCRPANDESTAEADVHVRIKAMGAAAVSVPADGAAYVDARVAAAVKAGATTAGTLAASLDSAARARLDLLTHASIGGTQAQVDGIQTARAAAMVDLDAALHAAAGSPSLEEAAFDSYVEADLRAYVDAGLDASVRAMAAEVFAATFVRADAEVDAETTFILNATAARSRARAVDAAVQAQFSALGAADVRVNQVAALGTQLALSLEASTAIEDIGSAWQVYHEGIVVQLQEELSTEAAAIAVVDASINGPAGLRLALKTIVDASLTTDATVEAYVDFFDSIRFLTESTLTITDPDVVMAVGQTLILVNLGV